MPGTGEAETEVSVNLDQGIKLILRFQIPCFPTSRNLILGIPGL